jgi:hypothetical protein
MDAMLDLSRLGVVAFFIILSGLWLRRIIITSGEKKDAEVFHAARLADSQKEAAEWKKMAMALVRRLDRMQGVLERLTGIPVPPDPEVPE